MRALSIGATGMMAQQLNVETISNNIANMSTTGYKRRRAEFQDLIYQNIRRVGNDGARSVYERGRYLVAALIEAAQAQAGANLVGADALASRGEQQRLKLATVDRVLRPMVAD